MCQYISTWRRNDGIVQVYKSSQEHSAQNLSILTSISFQKIKKIHQTFHGSPPFPIFGNSWGFLCFRPFQINNFFMKICCHENEVLDLGWSLMTSLINEISSPPPWSPINGGCVLSHVWIGISHIPMLYLSALWMLKSSQIAIGQYKII